MKEYRTINKIAGPLVFVEKTEPIAYGELVNIILSDGTTKRGQVLDTSDELVVVQIFETTTEIWSICQHRHGSCPISCISLGHASHFRHRINLPLGGRAPLMFGNYSYFPIRDGMS